MLPEAPPPTPPLPLQGTPVHTHSVTTDCFLPKYENRESTFRWLSNEMSSYFVGPVPPLAFLDAFLPLTSSRPSVPPVPTFKRGMFSGLLGLATEANMYDNFVSSNPLIPAQSLSLFSRLRLLLHISKPSP